MKSKLKHSDRMTIVLTPDLIAKIEKTRDAHAYDGARPSRLQTVAEMLRRCPSVDDPTPKTT